MASGHWDFESLFSEFITYLKNGYNLVTVSADFSPNKDPALMISSALELLKKWPRFEEILQLVPATKNNALSAKHRGLGNPFYAKKQLPKALEHYNASILYAETPTLNIETTCDDFKSNGENLSVKIDSSEIHTKNKEENHDSIRSESCLSLGYANRSAVLFDLELYKLSLDDIERSLKYQYPHHKKKLFVRKIKCLTHLNLKSWIIIKLSTQATATLTDIQGACFEFSEDLILKTTKQFDKIELESKELSDLKNYIQAMISTFVNQNMVDCLREESLPSSKNTGISLYESSEPNSHPKLDYLKSPSKNSSQNASQSSCSSTRSQSSTVAQYIQVNTPEVDAEHGDVRGLSSNVQLAYAEHKGRHLVAQKDILPGTVIAVDHGYGTGVVLPTHCTLVCSTCFHYCTAPLPCTHCTMVVFCSEACRDAAMLSHHGRECCLLPTLRKLDMGRNSELALRILTNQSYSQFKKLLKIVQEDNHPVPEGFKIPNESNVELSASGQIAINSKKNGLENNMPNLSDNVASIENLCDEKNLQSCSDENSLCNQDNITSVEENALNGVYGSHNYHSIYHLVGNATSRSVADLFKRSVMACVLLKLLQNSHYFCTNNHQDCSEGMKKKELNSDCNDSHKKASSHGVESPEVGDLSGGKIMPVGCSLVEPTTQPSSKGSSTNTSEESIEKMSNETKLVQENDYVLIGCILLRHMLNLPCNAHSITLFNEDVQNIVASHSQEIGANAFAVLSLTNHSCSPNCYRQSYGKFGVLRAVEFIAKGVEICDCYGGHFALNPKTERQVALKRQYYFDCACEACTGDWHQITCACDSCTENFCFDCHPICPDGKCKKNTATLPFSLKCLKPNCGGRMNVKTNSCSVCLQSYDPCSNIIKTLLSFESSTRDVLVDLEEEENISTQFSGFSDPKSLAFQLPVNVCASGNANQKAAVDPADKISLTTPGDFAYQVTVLHVVEILQKLVRDYENTVAFLMADKESVLPSKRVSSLGEKCGSTGEVKRPSAAEERPTGDRDVRASRNDNPTGKKYGPTGGKERPAIKNFPSNENTHFSQRNISVDKASVVVVERLVTALSGLVVRPNKLLLKSQELLKHCYDRQATRLRLPS